MAVDNSEAYRAKLFGPRIRILVQDLNTLPLSITLPRLEGDGRVKYLQEYSGLPNQCGRCRSRHHPVRSCPRKDVRSKIRKQAPKPQPAPKTASQVPARIPVLDATTPAASQSINSSNTTQTPKQDQQATPDLDPDPQVVTEIPAPESSLDMVGADTSINKEVDNGPAALQQDNIETPHAPSQPAKSPIAETTKEDIEIKQGNGLEKNVHVALQQDEINFLPLSSPQGAKTTTPIHRPSQEGPNTPSFVWRVRNDTIVQSGDRGKGKQKQSAPRGSESTPLTRQGYRTGRLAEDFSTTLDMPNIPNATHKKLKVIPLLLKNPE